CPASSFYFNGQCYFAAKQPQHRVLGQQLCAGIRWMDRGRLFLPRSFEDNIIVSMSALQFAGSLTSEFMVHLGLVRDGSGWAIEGSPSAKIKWSFWEPFQSQPEHTLALANLSRMSWWGSANSTISAHVICEITAARTRLAGSTPENVSLFEAVKRCLDGSFVADCNYVRQSGQQFVLTKKPERDFHAFSNEVLNSSVGVLVFCRLPEDEKVFQRFGSINRVSKPAVSTTGLPLFTSTFWTGTRLTLILPKKYLLQSMLMLNFIPNILFVSQDLNFVMEFYNYNAKSWDMTSNDLKLGQPAPIKIPKSTIFTPVYYLIVNLAYTNKLRLTTTWDRSLGIKMDLFAICNGTQSVTLEHPYHGSATLPCFRNSLVVYQKLSPNLETGRTPVDYRTGFALGRPAMDFNFTQADQMSFWNGLDFLELLPTYFARTRQVCRVQRVVGRVSSGGYPMHAKDCRTGTLDEYTFVELNNAQFGLFSNLSCAQPLSPWWQSQCDGKNLIKLAKDSNGAPRWMPDLPADNGVSVRMRLFAPSMIPKATESDQVSDACTMDAECSSENMTVCIPRGSALTPQCGCANLQDQSQPVCTITVDMSIVAFNVTFDPVPVRGCASRYTATIHLKHASGSADIPEAAPPKVLANFFSYFLNKSSSVYPPVDQEFYLQHNPVTVIEGNLQGSYKLYEEFEFVITANFTMPEGGQCVSASYLCIGFSASENETVRDSDPTNNALCVEIDSLKECQPLGDTELTNYTLLHLTPNPLVRHQNVSVGYHLSVHTRNVSSGIQGSVNDNNFIVLLHLTISNCQNLAGNDGHVKSCLAESLSRIEMRAANESVFKSRYVSGDTFSVSVHAPLFEISQNQCNKTTHFCVLLTSSVNSSYSESNFSNSLACHPVETFCTVFSDIALQTVAPLRNASNPWVPEYRHTASFLFVLQLVNGSKIDPVLSPSINFEPNISIIFQNASYAPLVMEGIECVEEDRTQGMEVGQLAYVVCDAVFFLSFQQCTAEQVTLRAGMINPENPSYAETNLENNWNEIEISNIFNCAGLKIDSWRAIHDNFTMPGVAAKFQIAWSLGTYMDCVISVQDGYSATWNWKINGSIDSYRNYKFTVSHVLNQPYGEYFVNYSCSNEISHFKETNIILLNPNLNTSLTITTLYERMPAPNNVTFLFRTNGTGDGYLKFNCNFTFYSDSVKFYQDLKLYYDFPLSISHVYDLEQSSVTSNVQCWNSGGNYTENFDLLFYAAFQISGVKISVNKSVLLTGEQFPVQLTVQNGTDVTYTVNMTDGTSQVIVHPEPLSYTEPVNITHSFNDPGVYDIHVLASSPINEESSILSGIIVQNTVTLMTQPEYFSAKAPQFDFPLTHTGAVPTNVTCKFIFSEAELNRTVRLQNFSEPVVLDCPSHLITEEMTLSVHCWNLVSQYAKNSTVVCNEPVSGLTANASHVFVQTGQNLTITIQVSNGTSVQFTTSFGDSSPEKVKTYSSKYAASSETRLAHLYSAAGNYTVIVNASNPVSWQTAQINPIVVLNPLINVSVTYRQTVLWPFEGAEFVINNEPNMQAGLVVCDFGFSTYGSKRIFIENLTDSSNAVVTFKYSVEAIGTQRVSMSCWNPLSIDGIERNFSIVVLKDSVKIANFSTNGTVWLGTPVEFVLDMTSFPNDTCILVYYNQTSLINEIFGAHNSCRSIATPNSPAYTQVSPSNLRITWKRDQSKVGVYSVLVFAYNNVSNDSAQTFATVIDIPCYKPRLRLFDSDASPLQVSSVQTIRRSEQINLTAVAPYNCSKLTNISTYWTIIAVQSSTQLPLCTDNSDQCLVQRRMLPYGLYNVSFTADLTVDAAMAETVWILLNVSKTPLSLEAITGPEYVSFNQTFVLNASATATDFDVEDGDLSGMTFQWSCFRPEDIPSQTEARALSELRGCFGNGPGVVYLGNASIAGSLTVNSFDLVPNASYVFRVRLTKDTREVWQSKTVFVESQPKPVGRLDCEQNCGAKVVAKRPLVYRLVCEQNCGHKFFAVSSNLTIVRLGVSGDEIEGTRQSSSDGQELSISAGTLMESSYYRVMGQLWNLGQETSYLVANITVNGPPVGGTCRVDPPGVVNMRTLAHLTCANWTEFGAFVAPLAYSATLFRWDPTESPTRFDSSSASFPTVLLPVGASSGLGSIEFKIADSLGAEAIFTINISISALTGTSSELLSLLEKLLHPLDSIIASLFASGDYSAAAVTLKSIALAMNAWNEDAYGAALSPDDLAAFQLRMTAMRLKYLNFVNALPFNFSDALQVTTILLRFGVNSTSQLDIPGQELAAKTLRKVIEQARIERANLSHKASEEIQDNQLKSGLSIWNASGFWAGNYSNRSMVKGVMLKTLDCIDSIGLLALESVSNFTKVEPGFALMGITQDVQDANVTGAKVETDMGSVSLPRFSAADPSGKCNITFMMSAADPYHWSQSESKVTTSFLRGRSQGCSFYDFPPSRGRSRRSASSSPTYEMQLAGAQVPLLRVAKTPTDKWLMMYHSFNATGEVVQLVIQPDAGHQLEVFLHEGTAPDPLNYTLHRVVPQSLNSTNDTATKELIFIPADMFSINQTVFVGCYAWDSGVDEWRLLDSAKCQASEQTAVARPAFKVNLFGSIGAGISFVPNTIDFGELFENWQGKLSESRAVLSVVIVLWVLFIPLAVLLRRMDLRDAQKFQFLPLKDEREQKGFVYKIEVFNGSKRGYEVPVGVFISVKGLNASELLRTLDDGERRNFESGGVDNFLMTTKAHLGDIRSICLTFDKTESGAGRWYVSRLIVTDCTNDNKYIFVIEDWLSPGIDSAVNCASSIDLKFSKNLVRNHLSRRMQDDHIWFSMLRRKVDTNFSRLQRLGVCWSLLFMTMIANAMWYEVADSSSEAFRIGPVKVSYGSLITSILGALTVLPVSMATVLLFLKSKRQPQHIEPAQRYRPQSSRSRRVINSDAATTEDETESEEEEKTWISKFSLPHWCQYVGWVLLVLSVLTAGVFIVFYAMDWGKEKSEGWLLAFFFSFFETVLLLQPLKVLAVGLVLALLMRKDYDSMDAHSVRVREIHDGREKFMLLQDVLASQSNDALRKKAKSTAISIGLNLAYLFLLYCVCYGSMDPVVFHLNNGLKMRLTVNQPSPQFSLDKVQKWEDIHTWLNRTVLPNLYPTVAANGQPLSEAEQKFISDGVGFRLGRVKLRQLRVRPVWRDSLAVSAEYSASTEDRSCYGIGWRTQLPCNHTGSGLDAAFHARTVTPWPTWGTYNSYSGRGYVLDLPNNFSKALSLLQEATHCHWIDNYTRAVLLECSLFYPDTNFFTSVSILTELPPFGGALSSASLRSTSLYRYIGASGALRLCAELLAAAITLVLLLLQLRSCWLQGFSKHFSNPWNVSHLLTNLTMIAGLVFLLLRSFATVAALESMQNSNSGNLETVMFFDESFYYCLGIAMFLVQIGFLNLVRYSRSLAHLSGTLRNSLSELRSFFWVFLVIFLAFAFIANLVLGPVDGEYRSLMQTMITQLSVMLGKFNATFEDSRSALYKILFFSYTFTIVFIVLNIFVVLLNESYADATNSSDDEQQQEAFQVVDTVIQSFKSIFRLERQPQYCDFGMDSRLLTLMEKFEEMQHALEAAVFDKRG
uniref:SRCR domain-containing protein n=1 Tax=Macrostomum lignano TaxID=282301 RepID=A0A1I8INE8_9PLAT